MQLSYRLSGGDKQNLSDLPGVEQLPDTYLDTAIHLLLRDPQWAYAYWSLSPASQQMVFGEDGQAPSSLFLRIQETKLESGGEVVSFDISVDRGDTQWNINLPNMGSSYLVDFCWRDRKGNEMSLAQSKSVVTYPAYWQKHTEELVENYSSFLTNFSSLVTKEGEIVDNPVIRISRRI